MNASVRKTVLLFEDEPLVMAMLKRIAGRLTDLVVSKEAADAGEALTALRNRDLPISAVVLDLMMPYGDAEKELDARTDPERVYTGVRLLQLIRREEREGKRTPVWVAAITARANYAVLGRVRDLLGTNGALFVKPFDPDLLEYKLAGALGVPCQVPLTLLEPIVEESK